MKNVPVLLFEILVVGAMVAVGLSGRRVLLVQGARSATIALGVMGLLLCTMSVGTFVSSAPAHPLSIAGYALGTVALLAILAQVFRWDLPVVGQPRAALVVLAVAMVAKSVIARFGYLLT